MAGDHSHFVVSAISEIQQNIYRNFNEVEDIEEKAQVKNRVYWALSRKQKHLSENTDSVAHKQKYLKEKTFAFSGFWYVWFINRNRPR